MTETPVRYGLDMLLTGMIHELQGQRVGLVTNDAATTSSAYQPLIPARQALFNAGVNVATLFSPEHGLAGQAPAGQIVTHGQDDITGAPVFSLYSGEEGQLVQNLANRLADLDILLFDLPDVGARFYTYIWTLSQVMESCALAGKPLWVLDRPNPLGGDLGVAEGPILDEALSSFVGRWPIPVRYSLTIGELAWLWRMERGISMDLHIVKMGGWQRAMSWPQTGNPFVPPSPAMPSYETALLYPGLCLVEGTNVSEGRGTAAPFRQIGAPWVDGVKLSQRLNDRNLPGVVARPVKFTPLASKWSGQSCQGIMLHPVAGERVRPVALGLWLLADLIALHPDKFEWLPPETADGPSHFDRLIGQAQIRAALTDQPDDLPRLIQRWTQTPNWVERVQPYLLYATG